eukprot:jgi/Chlat1/4744/Chrsp308S04734
MLTQVGHICRLPNQTPPPRAGHGLFNAPSRTRLVSTFPSCHPHPVRMPKRGSHPRLDLDIRCQAAEAARPPPPPSTGVFNRDEELEFWLDLLGDEPETVMVMIGPRNCGKTSLLLELQRIRSQTPGARVDYFSMRANDVATPTAFAYMLTRSKLWTLLPELDLKLAFEKLRPEVQFSLQSTPPAAEASPLRSYIHASYQTRKKDSDVAKMTCVLPASFVI